MDNFSLQNWRIIVVNEDAFREGMGELNVYGYQTNHFDICPGAQTLFKDILRGEFTDGVPSAKEQDKIVELAKLHDILFKLEKIALKDQGDAKIVFDKVIETASDIYTLGTEIGLDKNTDLRYIQGHVERVNDAAQGVDDIGRPLDEIELEIPGEENAPAGDKVLNKKLTKNDKIIAAYKEIEQEIKDSIKKIKTRNELEKKVAMDFLKSNQDTIKAYNNLKKV